jgi:hypothetical protein
VNKKNQIGIILGVVVVLSILQFFYWENQFNEKMEIIEKKKQSEIIFDVDKIPTSLTDVVEPKIEYQPPKELSIGDSTTIGRIMYTVFKEPETHNGDSYDRPDGAFFKTYVKVLNLGKDGKLIFPANFVLLDSENRMYDPVTFSTMGGGKDLIILEEAQPNLEKELWVTFDVPFNEDEKYRLVVGDENEISTFCVFNC